MDFPSTQKGSWTSFFYARLPVSGVFEDTAKLLQNSLVSSVHHTGLLTIDEMFDLIQQDPKAWSAMDLFSDRERFSKRSLRVLTSGQLSAVPVSGESFNICVFSDTKPKDNREFYTTASDALVPVRKSLRQQPPAPIKDTVVEAVTHDISDALHSSALPNALYPGGADIDLAVTCAISLLRQSFGLVRDDQRCVLPACLVGRALSSCVGTCYAIFLKAVKDATTSLSASSATTGIGTSVTTSLDASAAGASADAAPLPSRPNTRGAYSRALAAGFKMVRGYARDTDPVCDWCITFAVFFAVQELFLSYKGLLRCPISLY